MSDINTCPFVQWPLVSLDHEAIDCGLDEILGSGTLRVPVKLNAGSLGVTAVVHICRQRGGVEHDYLVMDEKPSENMTHDFALHDVAEGDDFTFDVFAIGPNLQGVMARQQYEAMR